MKFGFVLVFLFALLGLHSCQMIRVPIESKSKIVSYELQYETNSAEYGSAAKEATSKLIFAEKSSEQEKVDDLKQVLSRIKLENFLNWQYYGHISFGSKNETFTMIYDTGSSWIWIPGERCGTCEGSMKAYSCKSSSTCKKFHQNSNESLADSADSNSNNSTANDALRSGNKSLNGSEIAAKLKKISKQAERDEWHHNMLLQRNSQSKSLSVSVVYGKGEIEGEVYTEDLKLAKAVDVRNQSFLLVYDIKDMQNHEFDGVCGLGFRKLEGGGLSLMENLKKQGKINRTIFSLFLSNELQSPFKETEKASELIIGGYDEKYVSGKINYFKVNHKAHWALDVSRTFVGKSVLSDQPIQAVLDSGTSLILMPKREFSSIMKYLKSTLKKVCVSQGVLVICACPDGNYNDFPEILIEAEGITNLTIKPDFYIRREKHRCSLLFGTVNSNQDQHLWVLGDVFMRQFYTIFDLEQRKIGIAQVPKVETLETKFYFDVFIVLGGMAVAIITGFIFIALIRWVSGLGKIKDSEKNPFLK